MRIHLENSIGTRGDGVLQGRLKIIAAIPERPVIEKILTHLGRSADARPSLRADLRLTRGPSSARARPARLDPQPPPRGPAREGEQE